MKLSVLVIPLATNLERANLVSEANDVLAQSSVEDGHLSMKCRRMFQIGEQRVLIAYHKTSLRLIGQKPSRPHRGQHAVPGGFESNLSEFASNLRQQLPMSRRAEVF